MAKRNVQSAYLHATFGAIIDGGFIAAPVIFLAHYKDYGITDKAAMFILQILRAKFDSKTGIISDSDLKMESSDKTIYRIRKDLKEIRNPDGEKVITIRSFYSKDERGHVVGEGTSYDFSALFDDMASRYPTGQNDVSAFPEGLYERTDGQNDEAEGQIGQSSPDKMTDTIQDIDVLEFKTSPNGTTLFSWFEWEFLDTGYARNIVTGERYPVRKIPGNVPADIVMKIDEYYPLYKK